MFHSMISLPPQKIPLSKFLMTSLHVNCGLPLPNQKSWLRLWLYFYSKFILKIPFTDTQNIITIHLYSYQDNSIIRAFFFIQYLAEVESRTHRSRPIPRTQKNPRPRTDFSKTTLSRPRTGTVTAKAKDRGHNFSKLWSANFS